MVAKAIFFLFIFDNIPNKVWIFKNLISCKTIKKKLDLLSYKSISSNIRGNGIAINKLTRNTKKNFLFDYLIASKSKLKASSSNFLSFYSS